VSPSVKGSAFSARRKAWYSAWTALRFPLAAWAQAQGEQFGVGGEHGKAGGGRRQYLVEVAAGQVQLGEQDRGGGGGGGLRPSSLAVPTRAWRQVARSTAHCACRSSGGDRRSVVEFVDARGWPTASAGHRCVHAAQRGLGRVAPVQLRTAQPTDHTGHGGGVRCQRSPTSPCSTGCRAGSVLAVWGNRTQAVNRPVGREAKTLGGALRPKADREMYSILILRILDLVLAVGQARRRRHARKLA
jgi:hypothetical protein